MSHEHLATFIRREARQQRMSATELARQAQMSRNGLAKLLRGEVQSPSLESLTNLAFALRVSPHHLYSLWLIGLKIPPSSTTKSRIDNSDFVADITYGDGALVQAGESFTKIWAIANRGQQTWVNRWIKCQDDANGLFKRVGDDYIPLKYTLIPSLREIPVPTTPPGQTVIIEVEFSAPDSPAYVISHWKMTDQNGKLCFPEKEGLRCCVNVISL